MSPGRELAIPELARWLWDRGKGLTVRVLSGIASQGNIPHPKILILMKVRVNAQYILVCKELFSFIAEIYFERMKAALKATVIFCCILSTTLFYFYSVIEHKKLNNSSV